MVAFGKIAFCFGPVHAIASTPSCIYLGGEFTCVGSATGSAAPVSAATGELLPAYSRASGGSGGDMVSVPDNSGGWYIGGDFVQVGGFERLRVAHILPNGAVDPNWNVALGSAGNSRPHALALSGSILYIAGYFTTINGEPRNNIAAVNAATGTALPWSPNVNAGIYTMAVSGGKVYIAGGFTSVNGQARKGAAAIDAATGDVTAWNPAPDGTINALAASDSTVYAVGNFWNIGGKLMSYTAALDMTSGAASSSWLCDTGFPVATVAVTPSAVYIAGGFTSIGALTRRYVAALNPVTGTPTSWDAHANGVVEALAVSGSLLYLAGDFTSVGGQARRSVAAIDISTGAATSWASAVGRSTSFSYMQRITPSGSGVYIMGAGVRSIGGRYRNNLAALDPATGAATSWDPNPNGKITALATAGSLIYAGGEFTSMGAKSISLLAAIDSVTGLATAWNPNPQGTGGPNFPISSLAVSKSNIYVGGWFSSIGGKPRRNAAALDLSSGAATIWDPQPDFFVNAYALSGSTLYIGGGFGNIAGQERRFIASFNADTGVLTNWNPAANGLVQALAVSGSTVYAGGRFSTIGGQNRSRIAALDAITGNATSWNPGLSGGDIPSVNSFAVTSSLVYVGGNFTSIGGQSRHNIAALDAETGQVSQWNPYARNTVYSLVLSGSSLYIAADFNGGATSDGLSRGYFAQFAPPPPTGARYWSAYR